MRITMVKKRLADGTECRKCQEATAYLHSRGLWEHIDNVVWAEDDDAQSPGAVLAQRLGIERAPFFVVRDDRDEETVYVSVLQLVASRFEGRADPSPEVSAIDPDDIGGI